MVREADETVNPAGVKGIGEIDIVGMSAVVANAVFPRHRQARPRLADPTAGCV